MNSIWNKNIELFSKRFPSLASQLNLSQEEAACDFWEVFPSKSGDLTAKENGLSLHSSYAPLREAESAVKGARTEEIWTAAFFSMGLGWTPLLWAKAHPDDQIIIVEPELNHFFAALKFVDLTPLFSHQKLILALQAGTDQVTALIENSGGFAHTAIIENKAQSAHAAGYFSALHALIERNKKKVQINNATLEKFSRLWLKNSCRNLKAFAELDGVKIFRNTCPAQLPVVMIAAGPTLNSILPHLKEIKKRAILVAVDTALRSCLKAGCEPDFVVLVDPQYYAFRHIAGLKSPSSILITESAAWPDVYRFDCRKKVLCSSLFPLGQYFEKKLGDLGQLGAGGSVSTTAWDFARLMGARKIYCAGLDLGYPKLQSHIRGSLFEEKVHMTSCRIKPSEKVLAGSLFAANTTSAKDYDGNEIFTDDKMKMFAWWFENKALQYKEIENFSLSSKSQAIPGFKACSVSELLNAPECPELRQKVLDMAGNSTGSSSDRTAAFNSALSQLKSGFDSLYQTARSGIKLAEEGMSIASSPSAASSSKISVIISRLEQTDKDIMNSQFKEAVSLVFPTENLLNKIFAQTIFPADKTKAMFMRSKIIYRELMNGIRLYQKNL